MYTLIFEFNDMGEESRAAADLSATTNTPFVVVVVGLSLCLFLSYSKKSLRTQYSLDFIEKNEVLGSNKIIIIHAPFSSHRKAIESLRVVLLDFLTFLRTDP